MDKQNLFICACHNVEHQLIMSYSDDDNYKGGLLQCSSEAGTKYPKTYMAWC